jgi:hypothetical protein
MPFGLFHYFRSYAIEWRDPKMRGQAQPVPSFSVSFRELRKPIFFTDNLQLDLRL